MSDSDSERVQAADEAGEHLADADRDVTRGQRWYAKLYLTALFGAVGVAIAGAIRWGLIQPELVVTATVEVGWLLEYLVAGLVVAFLVWTVAMILVALPGSFISGTISGVARVADAYELPGSDQED